jgi:8-oxo-dGTP pyrophosphatase MutT (NUDIX family)
LRVPEDADRDFTASVFVIRDNKILLMKHSKLGMWLQPGGHIEEDETPDEAARRETVEETGFEIEFVEDFVPEKTLDETDNCPRPFNINLHPIRDDHYHCDFQFLGKIKQEKEASQSHEHDGLKWFTKKELESRDYKMPENMVSSGVKALSLFED